MNIDNSKKFVRLVAIVLGFFLLYPSIVGAQVSSISLVSSPATPGPGETTILTVESTTVDIDTATISWYKNDELRLSGVGETRVQLISPEVGGQDDVRVVVQARSGGVFTSELSIAPQEVDLLWEAVSYTPPFYKGKALPSSGGLLILTAIPNLYDTQGRLIDPRSLIYTWEQKGVVLGNASGLAKQRIILSNTTSEFDLFNVSVTVSTKNGQLRARNSVNVPIYSTEVVFYEVHPLVGTLYNRAIMDSISFVDRDSVSLKAEPFHFSTEDYASGELQYEWKVNGQSLDIPVQNQTQFMEFGSEGLSDEATVSISIINNNLPFRVFQEVERFVKLIFQ